MATRALIVELTSECRHHCRYCYYQALPASVRSPSRLPRALLVERVVAFAQAAGFGGVMLSGGEPFAHPECLGIIGDFRAAKLGVSLISDAEPVGPAEAAELARLGVWRVQPTLLGGSPEVHDRLKSPGSFVRTLRGLAALRGAGVPVCISFVCTRENAEEFVGVLEVALGLGVGSVAVSRMCTTSAAQRELLPTAEQLSSVLALAERARSELGLNVELAITAPRRGISSAVGALCGSTCAQLGDSPGLTVDPLGRVRPCALSATILGELGRDAWPAIQAAFEAHRARLLQPASRCAGCAEWSACLGGCRESARGAWGSYGEADPLCGSL